MWFRGFFLCCRYIKDNGQACPYVIPPDTCLRWTNPKFDKIVFDEVQIRRRRFTLPRLTLKHSTIWIRLSLLFKWVIVVVKIAKLSSTQSIRLAITGGKKANRTLVPAIDLESFHLRLDPSLWRSGLKYPVPAVVHTNSSNPSNLKKSTLGSGLEICGFVVLILWGA